MTKTLLLICVLVVVLACFVVIDGADSLEFDELQTKAKETYAKVIPCLKQRPTVPHGFNFDNMQFPGDAEQHYKELLEQTKKYRTNIRPHEYTGYNDTWIENYFIEEFSHLPLSFFGGFIPIFVQVRLDLGELKGAISLYRGYHSQ